jgi:hypothetical protein
MGMVPTVSSSIPRDVLLHVTRLSAEYANLSAEDTQTILDASAALDRVAVGSTDWDGAKCPLAAAGLWERPRATDFYWCFDRTMMRDYGYKQGAHDVV